MPNERKKNKQYIEPINPLFSESETIWNNEIKDNLSKNTSDSIPYMLMPLRIETRFMQLPNNTTDKLDELWVRIYPDDIFIEATEDELTESEESLGEAYWEEWWASGGDANKRKGAWRALCHAIGSRRAAWIVKKRKPINYPVQDCFFNPRWQVCLLEDSYTLLGWYQHFNCIGKHPFKLTEWTDKGDRLTALIDRQISRINEYDIVRDSYDETMQCFNMIEKEQIVLSDTISQFQADGHPTALNIFSGDIAEHITPYQTAIFDVLQKNGTLFDIKNNLLSSGQNLNNTILTLTSNEITNDDLNRLEKTIDSAIWYSNIAIKTFEAIENFNGDELESEKNNQVNYEQYLLEEGLVKNSPESPINGSREELIGTKKIQFIERKYDDIQDYISFYSGHSDIFSPIELYKTNLTNIKLEIGNARLFNKKIEFFKDFEKINRVKNDIFDRFTSLKNLYITRWGFVDCINWSVFDHLPAKPVFKPKSTGNLAKTWTKKPVSNILPERFVAVGVIETFEETNGKYNGTESYDFVQLEVGNIIPHPLVMGIDPQASTEIFTHDTNGNLIFNDDIKWMFDIDEAVAKGMAIKMNLKGNFKPVIISTGAPRPDVVFGQAENVFDKLLVLGLKATDPKIQAYDAAVIALANDPMLANDPATMAIINDGRPLLEDITKGLVENLFNSHHYSPNGMDFLEIGTPTNNTSNSDSGYRYDDLPVDESYGIEVDAPLFTHKDTYLETTDGQRLADALGLEYEIFDHIQHADKKQISDALRMNHLMFSGTLGNYMQDMFPGVLTFENVEVIKRFFNQYVSGRGMLPSLRVGSQPYGINITTAWSKWKFWDEQSILDQLYPDPPLMSTYQPIDSNVFNLMKNSTFNYMKELGDPRFFYRFKEMLDYIQEEFMILAKDHVEYIGKKSTVTPPLTGQEQFMSILGLQAGSTEYYSRLMSNYKDISNPITIENGVEIPNQAISDYNSTFFYEQANKGFYYSSGNDLLPFINSMFYTKISEKLIGHKIDEYPLSELRSIKNNNINNYIDGLSNMTLADVFNDNLLTEKSLFYILLRQTHLISHLDIFNDFFISNNFNTNGWRVARVNSFKSFGGGGTLGARLDKSTIGKFPFFISKSLNELNSPDFYYLSTNLNLFYPTTQDLDKTFGELIMDYNNINNPLMTIPKLEKGFAIQRMNDYKNNLNYFKLFSTSKLEKLMHEHIDLCSYRLDAWISGMITNRLFHQRNLYKTEEGPTTNPVLNRTKGIYLGAYGWIDNVKPGNSMKPAVDNSNPVVQSTIPEKLRDTNHKIYTDKDNQGYIHTPSLAHAVTAAILRSGYLSNKDNFSNYENQMAVSLNSDRVKKALFFIEGVKNGQSFGALLGYQFERGLHEKYSPTELDKFIYPIRRKFPLVLDETGTKKIGENEFIKPQNIVDGLSLMKAVREVVKNLTSGSFHDKIVTKKADIETALGITTSLPAEFNAIALELDYLADNIDAVADLAISEGVFQVASGNYARASSALESLSKGTSPSEVEVVNTPRTGKSVNHKIITNFDVISDINYKPSGWDMIANTPRALNNLSLNKWIASFFPVAQNIKLLITIPNNSSSPIEKSLTDFGLQPIDYVYLLGGTGEGVNELNERIAYFVRLQEVQENLTYDIELSISFKDRMQSWNQSIYTIHELMPIITNLYKLITESKYLNSKDFDLPISKLSADNLISEELNLLELKNRAIALKTAITNLTLSIDIASINTLSAIDLREFLLKCSHFGILNSIPFSAIEIGDVDIDLKLANAATNSFNDLNIKLIALNTSLSELATIQSNPNSKEKEIINKIIETIQIVFGKEFKVIPQFKIKEFSEIKTGLTKSSSICRNMTNGDMDLWSYSVSRVRSKVNSYETVNTLSSKSVKLTPIQFPYKNDDYWLGWEYPDNYMPNNIVPFIPENKSSLVLCDSDYYNVTDKGTYFNGLVIDEWIELIPEKKETTGITFHYDQPNMKPPQNILLTVTPVIDETWNWDNLLYTLLDTQRLAKMRAVEPDHILSHPVLGHMFPAIVGNTDLINDNQTAGSILNTDDLGDVYFDYKENNK